VAGSNARVGYPVAVLLEAGVIFPKPGAPTKTQLLPLYVITLRPLGLDPLSSKATYACPLQATIDCWCEDPGLKHVDPKGAQVWACKFPQAARNNPSAKNKKGLKAFFRKCRAEAAPRKKLNGTGFICITPGSAGGIESLMGTTTF